MRTGCRKPDPHVDVAPDGTLLITSEHGVILVTADYKSHQKIAEGGYLGRFSPDGKRLCYGAIVKEADDKESVRKLVIYDRTTNTSQAVLLEHAFAVQPVWHSDGESIWVPQADCDTASIVQIDALTGAIIQKRELGRALEIRLERVRNRPYATYWKAVPYPKVEFRIVDAPSAQTQPASATQPQEQMFDLQLVTLHVLDLDSGEERVIASCLNFAAGPARPDPQGEAVYTSGWLLETVQPATGDLKAQALAEQWENRAVKRAVHKLDLTAGTAGRLAVVPSALLVRQSRDAPLPIVSPDGKWLLLRWKQKDQRENYALDLVSADGRKRFRLTDAGPLVPAWLSATRFAYMPIRPQQTQPAAEKPQEPKAELLEVFQIGPDGPRRVAVVGPVLSW